MKKKLFTLIVSLITALLFYTSIYFQNNLSIGQSTLYTAPEGEFTNDSSVYDNILEIQLNPLYNFQTIYNQPLKLEIYDNGNIKIHGKIRIISQPSLSHNPLAIAIMLQPLFKVGNKPQYQVSNFELVRDGARIGLDEHRVYLNNGYYSNSQEPSIYRPMKLILQKSNDGFYYLYMDREDYNEILTGEEVYIQSEGYWSFFDKSITYKQIQEKASSLDETKFNFLFVPDIHATNIDSRVSKGIALLKASQMFSDIPVITTGDITDEQHKVLSNINNIIHESIIKNIVSMLGDNFLWCKGNHDDNSIQSKDVDNVVSESVLRELILNQMNPKGLKLTFSNDGLYYFADDEQRKIRLVFLNTHENDYSVTSGYIKEDTGVKGYMNQKQLEFVANVALDFSNKGSDKANWHTVFFSHYPFNFPGIKAYGGESSENGTEMWSIIKAFKEGTNVTVSPVTRSNPVHNLTGLTKNFATQGAMNIVGCFYGHYHNDQLQVKDGITLVSSEAFTSLNYSSDWQQISRQVFSYDEFSFDIVTIDKTARTVSLKRIGNDSLGDRSFAY